MFSLMVCMIDWAGTLIRFGDSMEMEVFAYIVRRIIEWLGLEGISATLSSKRSQEKWTEESKMQLSKS